MLCASAPNKTTLQIWGCAGQIVNRSAVVCSVLCIVCDKGRHSKIELILLKSWDHAKIYNNTFTQRGQKTSMEYFNPL